MTSPVQAAERAGRAAGLALLARTAVHLRPAQVAHRARLRAQRGLLRRWPGTGRKLLAGPAPATAPGWPGEFQPLDARTAGELPVTAGLLSGQLSLLGLTRDLGDPPDWTQPGAPRLWRFHLHYWDWAWGLAADPDRPAACDLFARLWQSWRAACGYRHPDAWHPYPAAVRAWSWCGLHARLAAGEAIARPLAAELAAHAGFLRRHLESDVGGNHLIKNLKALAGLGVFFGDDALLRWSLRRLGRQLAIQVLCDGGHYERAPAYHCQVLADLIDVADLLSAAGQPAPSGLRPAIEAMRGWLGAVLGPDGQVPLLNDGYPVRLDLVALLGPGPRPAGPLLVLPDTGLVRAQAGGWRLLADAGLPCPAGLPAHAHADSLSCVLHVDGVPLLVDTGTSSYAAGPVRDYERSTAAHNTVEVDGVSSTEVWGAFRAARRARIRRLSVRAAPGEVSVEAAHDGYRRLRGSPVHCRRWSLTGSGLDVDDVVTGSGRHSIAVYWHLPPAARIRAEPPGAVVTTPGGRFHVAISGSPDMRVTAGSAPAATGFGRVAQAPVLVCRIEGTLPVQVRTRWSASRSAPGEPPEVTA